MTAKLVTLYYHVHACISKIRYQFFTWNLDWQLKSEFACCSHFLLWIHYYNVGDGSGILESQIFIFFLEYFFEFRYSKVMQRQIFIFLNMLKSDILLLTSAVMFACFVIPPLMIFPKKGGGVPGVTPLNLLDKVMHSSYNWVLVLSWICIQTLLKKNLKLS